MEIAPMNTQVLDARRDASGGYRVDVSRGERVGRVSSEWFSRPADQRYLSLTELANTVRDRTDRSRTRVVESALIHVEASRGDPERLALMLPGSDKPVAPTHWSFGQLASQVGAPAAYLRQLPAALAGINLQYGLTSNRAEQIKTLETDDARVELRAVTSPDYGRIFDHELVEAVQRIAGNGTGDTRWKVPAVLDWSTGIYNPRVDISKDTTTLYASDRDVFLFLVDDLNPIEAGQLSDGSPDLYFRVLYCWNSEVGAKMLGITAFISGPSARVAISGVSRIRACTQKSGRRDLGADSPLCPQQRRESRHSRTAASGHSTKSLRDSPLRGSKSRETGSRLRE